MPSQQIPAAPVVGVVSRRHAKLLHHLFENNGGGNAPIKDLRIRRVVPPASAPPPDASPDPPAAAKPGPVPVQIQAQSTPPEPSAAAAAQDRERKPMMPRSKLVRDPASFGYRRLLPFLNQMAAKNGSDISDGKDSSSEPKVAVSTNNELAGSESGLVDESLSGSQGGAVPVTDPVEPVAVEAAGDREMKDCCGTVREEEPKAVPADPASSKLPVARCVRSKFVHHPSSFSYKRMLPFLMENEISSQEEDRCKIRRVSEEGHITSDENEEHNAAEVDRVVEEVASMLAGNCAGQIHSAVAEVSLDGSSAAETQRAAQEEVPASVADPLSSEKGELTPDMNAVPEVSLDGSSAAEAQRVAQEEVPASVADPLSSEKGELTSDMNAVLAGGHCQLAVSEDSPRERDVAGAEITAEEKTSQSDEKSVPMDSSEPLVAKGGGDQEMKDRCNSATEQTKIVPGDLASGKQCLARCTRSRLVHQRNLFSYKRMLPFLMENEISSQEVDIVKLQRVPEKKQLTSDKSDVMACGDHHLSTLKDSAEACYRAEVERIVEEITSAPYENCLVKGGQLQSAVVEVSLDGSTAQVQKLTPEVVLSSDNGELALDGDGVLPSEQCQGAVSEDLPKESNVADAEKMVVEEKATKSDVNSVPNGRDIQSAVSEVSLHESDMEKEATLKHVLASDGGEASGLSSDKAESLLKDQHQLCDSKKLLQDNAELAELQQCQSSESGRPDAGFASPTNIVMVGGGADQHDSLERQDSVAFHDALLLDVGMISKPSDPCASDTPLSAEEVSGCLTQAESGLRKVGESRTCGSPLENQCLSPKKLSPANGAFSGVSCLKKRVLSPKKLSPKKGILKRHTMGCKGICMCLDCSVFRLRADRAFEFSRKQMQEADDIIGNLLEEVASLRSLAAKSSGQQEQIEEACERASRVEEVARERRQQMLAELTAHCKIPGPRVKFAQYVDEKMALLSPRCSSNSDSRRQPSL